MSKSRLEAFSDGVIAIIITIIVLLIDLPEGDDWQALKAMLPLVACYAVSFTIVGVNWVNHHHLFQIAENVSGRMLWANLLYLFVLSFIPVTTGWVGRSGFGVFPTRVYSMVNLSVAIAYILLQKTIVVGHENSRVREEFSERGKEVWVISMDLLALASTYISKVHYVSIILLIVAIAPWIIPDLRSKRIIEDR